MDIAQEQFAKGISHLINFHIQKRLPTDKFD